MDRGSAKKNRVAVGRRMRDELRGERSPGAGLIVDENRAEARFHLVGPGAADNVEHAAGRKRQNKPDRPTRIERGGGRMRRPPARRLPPLQQKTSGVPMS